MLDSQENFEDNKLFLKRCIERESNLVVIRLLKHELTHFDRIQVQIT